MMDHDVSLDGSEDYGAVADSFSFEDDNNPTEEPRIQEAVVLAERLAGEGHDVVSFQEVCLNIYIIFF